MLRIEAHQSADLPLVASFVAAIQEHERASVPGLKPGAEIAAGYAEMIERSVRRNNGVILMARRGAETVGFAAAWIETDPDPCLEEAERRHAYVSDIYVVEAARRQGVGHRLLAALEAEMRKRGCRRIRLCAKATNAVALACYEAAGYRPYEVILSKPIG
jgi:ribosomal protein S18 acetylase RimI-like enzyme